MIARRLAFAAALLSAACRPHPVPSARSAAVAPAVVTFPEGYRARAGATSPVFAHAVVSSESAISSVDGLAMLRAGGNAIDAAVATAFSMAVTYPEAGNLGGGGFLVVRMADGKAYALDFRETAPAAATRDMYVDSSGSVVPGRSTTGHLAVGVPGSVAGLVAVHARLGRLPLAQVVAPAIRHAREGIVVDSLMRSSLNAELARIGHLAAGSPFLPGGGAPAVGDTIRQPALATTLERIVAGGADGFYRGPTAEALVAEMRRGGGLITMEDLARYHAIWRDPVVTHYHGHEILGMPPVSSGGVTIAETLGILSTWPDVAPFGSATAVHRLASAYQRAFIERNARLGDPDFVSVPVELMSSASHARDLRATIDDRRATSTAELAPRLAAFYEGSETTHLSVADADGNVVAMTSTLNDLWGAGVFAAGAGIFLNDTMDDFTARPGVPNMYRLVQGAQNAVAPGKRPLSAMSPTIVVDSSGAPLLVVGSRGGPRIITSVSQVILDVLDHHMSLADAMVAPRIHHQAMPDILAIDPFGVTPAVRDSLVAMGWTVQTPKQAIGQEYIGLPVGVMRVPGGWTGAADARRGSGVVGY